MNFLKKAAEEGKEHKSEIEAGAKKAEQFGVEHKSQIEGGGKKVAEHLHHHHHDDGN